MPDCKKYLESNDYVDIMVRYSKLLNRILNPIQDFCFTIIDDRWSILHISRKELPEISFGLLGYTSIPEVYGVQDYGAMEAAGINRVREQPFLNLRGGGTLIGIVDTGINYTHDAFINEDGTSKIEGIWDQTIHTDEPLPEITPYGKVYTQEMINEALAAQGRGENPRDIVPVTDDESGHGTFIAGIAAGKSNIEEGFIGAAPDAGIVLVKLKQAKEYLREFYLVNEDALCYSETDIIMGVRFLDDFAENLGKPISIIIGIGNNLGAHIGSSILAGYLDKIAINIGRCVTVAAGNYANSRLHFRGRLNFYDEYIPAEIRVGEGERGFLCGLWSEPPQSYAVGIVSPTGQIEQRIVPRLGQETSLNFTLEGTRIQLFSGVNEALSGQNFTIMKFINPFPGIWTLRVYGQNFREGEFNLWLSNREFLWADTHFIAADPYQTITEPGNSIAPITTGAYDYRDGSIYLDSGRGYTAAGRIKPELAAPGVNIIGPSASRNNAYDVRTGTSIAAAITAGGAALLLEYGIVKGNLPFMRTYTIKNYLVSGADRRESFIYPDRLFGYGTLNLYQAIEGIRR